MVGIVIGSDSDLPIMSESVKILEEFEVPVEITVASAHRSPSRLIEYVTSAPQRGVEVIIAASGRAAHLAGVLAAHTTLPVIGVPIGGGALSGIDALLSTAQMPPGVPVATMAVDGARNAGIYAAQILALKYPQVKKRVDEYKSKLAKEVELKTDKLASMGYKVWQPR